MPVHGSKAGLVHSVTIFLNQQVFTRRRDAVQNLSVLGPELNLFHRYHKVPLTFKIHNSGFIHWSEVARAPKTNRGLRSGDQQWPGAQDTSHRTRTQGRIVGDNARHEF